MSKKTISRRQSRNVAEPAVTAAPPAPEPKRFPLPEAVRRHPYRTAAGIFLLAALLGSKIPPVIWFVAFVPLLMAFGILLHVRGRLTEKIMTVLIYAIGFCMRYGYVLATPYTVRCHDSGNFGGTAGHAGYITYFYNNFQLPDFDVRTVSQFYHPPLHHLIAAIWMRIQTFFGVSFETAGNNVQLLTLVYSCLCMMLFSEILHTAGLKGTARTIPLALLAFHPTFFLLAGSMNNDMLSITFMLASILLTLKWYRDPQLSTILKLALTIGCGMMTKLSAWMVAPAAAAAFLMVLIQNRKKPWRYIGQYAAFGVVCVPLGLWWGIRNFLMFQVPVTYVPMFPKSSSQYVGGHSILERFFDFSPYQWTYVYDCFTMYGQSYNEFNPSLGILKTAMYDEVINTTNFPAIRGFGEGLFLFQFLLVAASLAAIVIVCIRKAGGLKGMEKLLLLLTYGITLISYYSFCIAFPHVCTMNIRYATMLIFIGLLFLGLWLGHMKEQRSRSAAVLTRVIGFCTAGFMACSFIVYSCVCA